MQKEYKIEWVKTYHRSGTETIMANSMVEAENLAREQIGDWDGKLEGTDNDEITVIGDDDEGPFRAYSVPVKVSFMNQVVHVDVMARSISEATYNACDKISQAFTGNDTRIRSEIEESLQFDNYNCIISMIEGD